MQLPWCDVSSLSLFVHQLAHRQRPENHFSGQLTNMAHSLGFCMILLFEQAKSIEGVHQDVSLYAELLVSSGVTNSSRGPRARDFSLKKSAKSPP